MQNIRGQSAAVELLLAQVAADRLHHAYIFHGPAGVGKFTTAIAFARLLLCHDPQADLTGQPAPCGQCESCRLLSPLHAGDPDEEAASIESPHLDLHIVAKELAATSSVAAVRARKQTNIPVDLLRELIVGGATSDGRYHDAPAYKSPRLRHGKIFIIDAAELLDAPGQNVLLKTLEQPPAGTTLILVTTSEDHLLPTIRSRCRRVAFGPLPDDTVRDWLAAHAPDLTDRQQNWLVDFAGGSLGQASLALDYALLDWARSLLPALDEIARGKPRPEIGRTIADNLKNFADAWTKAHPKASREAANQLAAQLMWSMLAAHIRRRLHHAAARCAPDDPLTSETLLEPWLGVIDALAHTQQLLAANVNLALVCDQLVVAIHQNLLTPDATRR